ncbi:MAG: response regulator [Terriglobia bacterium]
MSRKVLVVEDEPSIRNLIYVLLRALKCEGEVAYNDQQALAMVSRGAFDAVLLDLRCSDASPEEVVSRIHAMRPNLVGRILCITSEVSDATTMNMIESNCLPYVRRGQLMNDLWDRLRVVFSQPQGLPSTR